MIKTHNQTNFKYLCKTACNDPIKYLGSGKHWKRHLKKHGRDVSTEILYQSEDLNDFNQQCLQTSYELNVVSSNEWANLIDETGLDGGTTHNNPHWLKNFKHSKETKRKIGDASRHSMKLRKERGEDLGTFRGRTHTKESRIKISESRVGIKFSDKHRENISKAKKGQLSNLTNATRQKISKCMHEMAIVSYRCNICGELGNMGSLAQYHKSCQLNKKYKPEVSSEKNSDKINAICVVCNKSYDKKRKSKCQTCSRSCRTKAQWQKLKTNEE